jgi:formate dehydrogenase maturation protein FdhE
MKTLTPKLYVDKFRAAVCPVCMSNHIESDIPDMDGSTGSAPVRCNDCGATWTDIISVSGYENLELPELVQEEVEKLE